MSILRGPEGERGKMGDHGQRGDTGETGLTGDVGETGETGKPGQTGRTGAQGARGPQGTTGLRGRALTWTQALAMFLFIVLSVVVLSVFLERQQAALAAAQRRIEQNAARIEANTLQIRVAQWESCARGRVTIERFNRQQEELAATETGDTAGSRERLAIYKRGVFPVPDCGPRPQ